MLILPTFILNYYVMRSAGILPYIRKDQEALVSKQVALAQVLAIVTGVYVWQSSAQGLLLLLAASALLLFILYSLSQGSQTKRTVLGSLLVLAATVYLQQILPSEPRGRKEY